MKSKLRVRGGDQVSREIDRRDLTVNRATARRRAELDALAVNVSDELPGRHRVSIVGIDRTTGNPAVLASTDAPSGKGNHVSRALNHLQNVSDVMGIAPLQPAEFSAEPQEQRTSSGSVVVHVQQRYKGIPIFETAQVVRFDPQDVLQEVWGTTVTIDKDLSPVPRLTVEEAVRRAATHVAVPDQDEFGRVDQFGQPFEPSRLDVTGFTPRVLHMLSEQSDQPAVLERGPFEEDIRTSLVWLPIGEKPVLCWQSFLTLPNYEGSYLTLVDADTGQIVYCRNLVRSATAHANVFTVDGGSGRETTTLPLALEAYGLPLPSDLPAGFPDSWVAADRTEGNNASARLGPLGDPYQGRQDGDRVIFDPADADSDDQKVVNLFYFLGRMHDFFYLLGFREAYSGPQNSDQAIS